MVVLLCALYAAADASASAVTAPDAEEAGVSQVEFHWGVKIPMRDGVRLNATLYTPQGQKRPAPCVFTLTPYIGQTYHERGMYFAAHGYPFLTIDVRGRGNSEGEFQPMFNDAKDGYDVVEWLARQPYCNGKVAMWGGSYAGTDQWATAKEAPPHLATIVPAAAAYMGVDFPMQNNIFYPYDLQWLTFTSGHALQDKIFGDQPFWTALYRRLVESGLPFKSLDRLVGNPSPTFQEWVSHAYRDAYWDQYSPTAGQYARLSIPILTITGSHDDDQPGALAYYGEYMQHATPAARARHYLVIGPWDHPGTRTPKADFAGLHMGPASLVDLPKLHLDWYAWTMQNGPKPEFLRKKVAYYVIGADEWHYADTLSAVTRETRAMKLDSASNADDVLSSGSLTDALARGKPDHYVYDPRDLSTVALESTIDPDSRTDQRMLYARTGKQLIYHTAPFAADTEISGFFELNAWLAIDQPDTDFTVGIYEVRADGTSVRLSIDTLRARYRESFREPKLIKTRAPLRYDFRHFTFISQLIKAGSRLRLVIAPGGSIYTQRNFNSGGDVSSESIADARAVTVSLWHDAAHPSTLLVPIGAVSN